jgi:hypothetical protein
MVADSATRSRQWPSCRVPGRQFGSSALRASGTKRSTGKFSTITRDSVSVIQLKFARQLGIHGDWRRRESRRIAIRRLLGASRLTTSGCSRLRAQASELTHVLATDPRRFAPLQRRECGIERQLSGSEFEGREFEGI